MDTLMLIKNIEMKAVVALYFNSEDEAILEWARLPLSEDWEVIYLKERKPSGHRYEIAYTNERMNILYPKYIICFSKKEALYLKNKIERIDQHYIIQIKKLY